MYTDENGRRVGTFFVPTLINGGHKTVPTLPLTK
jgi:hypothetical protein